MSNCSIESKGTYTLLWYRISFPLTTLLLVNSWRCQVPWKLSQSSHPCLYSFVSISKRCSLLQESSKLQLWVYKRLHWYGTAQGQGVTLYVTPHRNSDPHFSMTQTYTKISYHVSHPQTLVLFLELHVLDPTLPSLFHTLFRLPWLRLCSPVSDWLIPLLCLQLCIVPHNYKSEPPMYCRPSSNIN